MQQAQSVYITTFNQSFCCCYPLTIEATYTCGKAVYETVKLSIWEGAVDPSIAFGGFSVKIITPNDNL